MNEFVLDRIACSLEKIVKSAANIETEMKKQTALLEPLSGCVIDMGGDIKRLRTSEH